jgi:DNA-binding MarR family transcriptional regulator
MTRRGDAGDFMDLFGLLKRRLMSLAAEVYATAGMTRTAGRFVRHIGRHARVSQAELARATDTDPALTGRTVQALIDEGLVRRKRSEEDRRELLVELTAAGRRAGARFDKARDDLARRIAAVLDERDRRDFERIVHKILAAFDAERPDA